jgi:hypothetical protein
VKWKIKKATSRRKESYKTERPAAQGDGGATNAKKEGKKKGS